MTIKRAALGSRWASEMEVADQLRQARENRAAHSALIASLDGQTQRRRAELEQSLSALPPSDRARVVSRSLASFRADLRRQSAATRKLNLRAADAAREGVAPIRAHYGSPVQMLMRQSLGSERRSRILQQIETSGPAELASLAEYAASTRDLEMAAALCSRNARVKLAERTFSARELADVLLGEEHRTVAADLAEIERLAIETAVEDAAFESGKRDATASLQVALMKRSETAIREGLTQPEPEIEE